MNSTWRDAPLVALDLEGSGAQDGADEAILEIAVVPLRGGRPDCDGAYTTLVNPGRFIPPRPWLSPGLAGRILSAAPPLGEVGPRVAAMVNGMVIVGHNIGVDWRLLHRRCPRLAPAGLLDTLRIARHLQLPGKHKLTTLLASFNLTGQVTAAAPGSRPHRALWDTVGTALLLETLIHHGWDDGLSLHELLATASVPLNGQPAATRPGQATLLDL
ncbi:MAG TPA: 3'-5' exonuclease [Micromonosporaceae bacterium]|nr:3'-5' exonuclease [Micromonosporaceae bacterium]